MFVNLKLKLWFNKVCFVFKPWLQNFWNICHILYTFQKANQAYCDRPFKSKVGLSEVGLPDIYPLSNN